MHVFIGLGRPWPSSFHEPAVQLAFRLSRQPGEADTKEFLGNVVLVVPEQCRIHLPALESGQLRWDVSSTPVMYRFVAEQRSGLVSFSER